MPKRLLYRVFRRRPSQFMFFGAKRFREPLDGDLLQFCTNNVIDLCGVPCNSTKITVAAYASPDDCPDGWWTTTYFPYDGRACNPSKHCDYEFVMSGEREYFNALLARKGVKVTRNTKIYVQVHHNGS